MRSPQGPFGRRLDERSRLYRGATRASMVRTTRHRLPIACFTEFVRSVLRLSTHAHRHGYALDRRSSTGAALCSGIWRMSPGRATSGDTPQGVSWLSVSCCRRSTAALPPSPLAQTLHEGLSAPLRRVRRLACGRARAASSRGGVRPETGWLMGTGIDHDARLRDVAPPSGTRPDGTPSSRAAAAPAPSCNHRREAGTLPIGALCHGTRRNRLQAGEPAGNRCRRGASLPRPRRVGTTRAALMLPRDSVASRNSALRH